MLAIQVLVIVWLQVPIFAVALIPRLRGARGRGTRLICRVAMTSSHTITNLCHNIRKEHKNVRMSAYSVRCNTNVNQVAP